MSQLVEVRIPTYKRPKWLERALRSLLAQTHEDWIAYVFDDSPDQEGKEVVDKIADPRIKYRQNPQRLGGAGNIDKAFLAGRFSKDAVYATILEDDNWFYPELLETNIKDIEDAGTNLLLRNQETWIQESDKETKTERTTREKWFRQKVYEPEELHAFLYFHEGISNGGMFWKISSKSNLMVGSYVDDPGLQEFLRTLQISEPIFYAEKPLSAWSKMSGNLITRLVSANRRYNRGRLSVMQHIFRKYGKEGVKRAYEIAIATGHLRLLEEALVETGMGAARGHQFIHMNLLERFELRNKARLRKLIIRNPLKFYFKDQG